MANTTACTGLKASITDLLTNTGSRNIEDYRIAYYKIGRRFRGIADGNFYDLDTPWDLSFYGEDTTQDIELKNILSDLTASSLGPDVKSNYHVSLPQANVTYAGGVAKIKFVVDRYVYRLAPFTEMGICIKNPLGYTDDDKPVLAAYATIVDSPYENTAEDQNIRIPVQWTISFTESL